MTTRESNKLLAEFLGYTQPHPDYPHTTYWYKKDEAPLTMLSFDTDWNWLMEVVEKIEQLRYVTEISGNIERKFTCIAYPNTSEEYISRIGYGEEMFLNKKYVTYQAVVAFIKWYNEQNK